MATQRVFIQARGVPNEGVTAPKSPYVAVGDLM